MKTRFTPANHEYNETRIRNLLATLERTGLSVESIETIKAWLIEVLPEAYSDLIRAAQWPYVLLGDLKQVLEAQPRSESKYRILKFWVVLYVTQLYIGACRPDVGFLLFLSQAYNLVDTRVDSGAPELEAMFARVARALADPRPTGDPEIDRIAALGRQSPLFKTQLPHLYRSMACERECHNLQKSPALNPETIARLTIDKSMSTGYLLPGAGPEHESWFLLVQLLDDLGDYDEDRASGITTACQLCTDYSGYAWYVLEIIYDLCQSADTWQAPLFLWFWGYSCVKNREHCTPELLDYIAQATPVSAEFMLELRKAKNEHWDQTL